MTIKVPFLTKAEIERDAEMLLAEYEETVGAPVKLPVPVDEITTYHLALQLGFADLHETLDIPMRGGQPDILGAIWVSDEAIMIDRSLDPKKYPAMLGRYRYSVGHEVGHWRLHRFYVAQDANQMSFLGAPSRPTVICRSSEVTEPIEWQANFHAACLLMPRKLVLGAWRSHFGDADPFVFDRARHSKPMGRRGGGPRALGAIFRDVAKPPCERSSQELLWTETG
ncbi:IrrE N-terminal-like domain containing protein [uncultured Caudovirales phage]|uniref:IrrE N-terminal-like domain containing protein n=1 Tax=uncultured Caudovirales phage TaxID=2100421 RepID=A0A6J5SRR4_9CAUD|nr:IrrE N-terminal-like domain containing protein [uncultured Caudovirales phage]CAB4218188.1 IrrE N-terminal-like domain containing protein [uncultured Caudovirales phage]